MALPLPAAPTQVYVVGVTEVKSADLNIRKTFIEAIKTFIETGIWTRTSLVDDSPVLTSTDQDANVKEFIDANGYGFGQVISENYWWRGDSSIAAGDNASLGAPFYLTAEETGFTVTADAAPSLELGCHMIKIACVAAPIVQNGATLSCDDTTTPGDNKVFTKLDDAIAVFETTFITDQAVNSASTFYAGFHNPGNTPDLLESATIPACCLVLDYGETIFEGMTCDGTTNSKSTTGITCAINTLYHLRVEYHGASTPQGVSAGGAVARFFVDGVLVLSKTTNMPLNAAWLGPLIGVQGFGSASASNIYVGPVRFAVNYATSSQVPA